MMFNSDSEEAHVVDEMDETTSVKSSLCCFKSKREEFSVQSGDIQVITVENDTDNAEHIDTLNCKDRLLHLVEKIVYKVVKKFFSNVLPPVLTLLVFLFLMPLGLLLLAVFVYPPQLDLSLRSFQIPNHESSLNYDAFQMALNPHVTANDDSNSGSSRSKRYLDCDTGHCPFCTRPQTLLNSWTLNIFYVSKDGGNILTEDRLEQIHKIEQNIVNHKYGNNGYEFYCHKSGDKCDPLNSLLTFFYPSYNGKEYVFDGNGPVMRWSIKETLVIAFQFESSYWYGNFTGNGSESNFLRTQLRVGLPIPNYCRFSENSEAIHEEITDYFLSFIPYLDSASTNEIEVLYGGTEVFDFQVQSAVNHDKYLAGVSLILVFPLVFILSGFSLFSTFTAILTILTSFPIAFFIYRVVFGIKAVGLLNVVSLFVIIGIGVDDVFVFLNTFKLAGDLKGVKTIQDRLAYTIIHASKATFLTSATTAVAFLANTLSAIPAVHQFGLFMSLVVISCYVQVTLVMPSFLYLWYKYLSCCEYFYFLFCLKKRNGSDADSLSSGEQESTDSGIAMNYQYLIEREPNYDDEESNANDTSDDEIDNLVSAMTQQSSDSDSAEVNITTHQKVTYKEAVNSALKTIEAGMKKMTGRVQWFMLKFIAWPVVYVRVPLLIAFAILLVISVVVTSFLKPSDKAPQFLDSDSNIQKLFELENAVSQQNDYDCWNCSGFFVQQRYQSVLVPPPIPSTVTEFPSTSISRTTTSSSSSTTSSSSTHQSSSSSSSAVKPSSTTTRALHTSSVVRTTSAHRPTPTPVIRPTTSKHHTTTTTRGGHTQHTSSTTKQTDTPTSTPPPLPSICGGSNYEKCVDNQAKKPAFGGGAIIYVVFGISGIKRTFSPSHVIPQDNDLGVTQFDSAFQQGMQICPRDISTNVVKALCHICKSITNSTLVQSNGAYCFRSNFTNLNCPYGEHYSMFNGIPECRGLSDSSTVTVQPVAQRTPPDIHHGHQYMLFMAMAFKSTTDINESPFAGYKDYLAWNDLLDAEMTTIRNKYGDDAYQMLKSAYQTSEYWVTVNTEIIAVYGAIYGILISFLLCMVLITLLSRNWRILISMFTTIIGILFLLMACFKMFGWSLGIVEAVTLSIIVGNSLDYCIHLTQAYQDMDHRHLALLNKLGITHYGIRSQKVIAGLAYIGISIISSAVTTFLATLPLLATKIQLFKKFGEILVLDTAIAILYTILFCGSMLTFIGPKTSTSPLKFQLITMVIPLLAIGLLILGLFIASKSGVDVPSPLGGYLFQ